MKKEKTFKIFLLVFNYFADRQKMLMILPANPTVPKMIMKTPTIQNLSGEEKHCCPKM